MLVELPVQIDSRLRLSVANLPREMIGELKAAHQHADPRVHKQRRMGFSTYGKSASIRTWSDDGGGVISLPRGATGTLREVAARHGYRVVFDDRRVSHPDFAPMEWRGHPPRPDQIDACARAIRVQQGIVRSPTGSGKTTTALLTLRQIRQPALVVMRDNNLLDQWHERCSKELGIPSKEIGVLRGGKKLRVGARVTLALQQTLYSDAFPLDEVTPCFGLVMIDEVHGAASRTFQRTINAFPAKYRLGYSADETRADRLECLVYDQMGKVIHELERDEAERRGIIMPVTVRLVPTEFEADWYREGQGGERDYTRLLEEITSDGERNEQLLDLVSDLVGRAEAPVLVFSHRVEHARWISDVGMFARRVRCGLMLGGKDNASRFAQDKGYLMQGALDAAAGTFSAIGQGIDVPNVVAGVMSTPIGRNEQFFNQVRGRMCRTYPGKKVANLYVMWDERVFPDAPKLYSKWNGGRVEVWSSRDSRWTPWRR